MLLDMELTSAVEVLDAVQFALDNGFEPADLDVMLELTEEMRIEIEDRRELESLEMDDCLGGACKL